jgi:hypothetical protein
MENFEALAISWKIWDVEASEATEIVSGKSLIGRPAARQTCFFRETPDVPRGRTTSVSVDEAIVLGGTDEQPVDMVNISMDGASS